MCSVDQNLRSRFWFKWDQQFYDLFCWEIDKSLLFECHETVLLIKVHTIIGKVELINDNKC